MNTATVADIIEQSSLLFPPEWIKSALVLALISVWMVIILFAYLNRFTRKPYFSLWTVSWMFYSVYLAASIGLEETPDTPFLVMARRACIGISALFMFWGSFELTKRSRNRRELGWGVILVLIWSYIAAYKVGDELAITVPVFALLAAACVFTGGAYMWHRRRYHGANILGVGFVLWGLHLLAFPFLNMSHGLMAGAYFVSSILALMITVGMIVEQEANVSEHHYRELFNSGSDAIFLVDSHNLRIMEANDAATRLTGRSVTDLAGRRFFEICPDLCRETGALISEQDVVAAINRPCGEFLVQRPDGSAVTCEGRANSVSCFKGPVLQITVRDVTERKRAEAAQRENSRRLQAALTELRRTQHQVIQQERLKALGEMASGVAHDFNNALAKILGFNELLLCVPDNLNDRDKVRKFLQMTSAAAQDAVKIVNRLREFYRHRKETDVYESVDINQLVEQAVILTQPKWKNQGLGNGVTFWFETNLGEIGAVRGNAAELREVLINMIFNAVDAMPQGGKLTVTTRKEDDHVVLMVADTGVGMTEEVRQRCLEPFFSTKGERGTGLGLAIVYGIIQRHGGAIDIQSQPGQGATFIVRLPEHSEQGAEALTKVTASLGPLQILLAEDEPLICDIQAEYLRNDGHIVETAANGAEALERFKAGSFDLVVADRAMPQMNGDQLTRAIKLMSPDTPVVMVSGFGDMVRDSSDPAFRPDIVMAKPITQMALRQAIVKVCQPAGNGDGHGSSAGNAPQRQELASAGVA
jgi:PAS domain S-box-containing protein